MPCVLHILNADGALDAWMVRIQQAFHHALPLVSQRIPVGNVDIVVYNDADYVVPELGISGFCTSPRRMYLPLDVHHRDLSDHFETRFQGFLAHELHHCARRGIAGYADTLLQALVTEGLACCFESELPGGGTPLYATAVDGEELERVRQLARPVLGQPLNGWGDWFFGERAPEIPHHAGYALGYRVVRRWLESTGASAAQAVAVPATIIWADP